MTWHWVDNHYPALADLDVTANTASNTALIVLDVVQWSNGFH